MTTPKAAVSARSIIWKRRRRSWNMLVAQFRRSRQGMLGLTIFVVFAAVALLSPVMFDESQLDVTKATGGVYESPIGNSGSARTTPAGMSSRWWCGVPASHCSSGCAPPCWRWSSAPPSVSHQGTTADWSPES